MLIADACRKFPPHLQYHAFLPNLTNTTNSSPNMSTEVVKKRGRPKKVIHDLVEVEMAESTKKATTRAKSTAATKEPAKPKAAIQKTSPTAKPVEAVSSPSLPQRISAKSSAQQTSDVSHIPPAEPLKITKATSTRITPETSKILNQVRELSTKNTTSMAGFSKHSKASPTAGSKPPPTTSKTTTPPPRKPTATSPPPTTSAKAKLTNPQQLSPAPPKVAQSNPLAEAVPPKTSPETPNPSKPAPKIPLASLNSTIVDNISTRAGARPNTGSSKNQVPPNYKPVARKVTMAIVAMPIVIVTSWVLYQRLVLGEERKLLVKPGLTMVETNAVEAERSSGKDGSS